MLVNGTWRYGVLRMWTQRADGSWWANVTWTNLPGEQRIDTFPAEEIRPLAGT